MSMKSDERLLLTSTFIRSFAISGLSIFFGLYLASLGLDETRIGLLISAGLSGMATGTLVASKAADRIGRRKMLVLLSAFMVFGGIGLTFSVDPILLVAATFIGMVNGMGRDRGALQAIDQAILAQFSAAKGRTAAFARYVFVTDIGGAIGALAAGIPQSSESYQVALIIYAAVMVAGTGPYFFMSPSVETRTSTVSKAVFSKQ